MSRSHPRGLLQEAAVGSGGWYAILKLLNMELGLIAIVVGLMVGFAVRWGSEGRGGWLYQGLAILLTYCSIVSTYMPFIIQEVTAAALHVTGSRPTVVAIS